MDKNNQNSDGKEKRRRKPALNGVKSNSEHKKEYTSKERLKKDFKDRKPKTEFVKTGRNEPVVKKNSSSEPMRLNKYIASSGLCSRREADELIAKGKVMVNAKVVNGMGLKVSYNDRVEVNGKLLSPEKKVYILLNKPKDCVSTVSDPHAERTVLDLIQHDGNERIYPVGRLDKNTTGVMLLTNDGELTKKLTHPSYNKKKIYHAILNKVITKGELQQILEGIELEDGPVAADSISFVNENDKREVGIELHSGRNRIVRRIFEHLGYRVDKLDRVYFAGLTKKNVPRGKWRYLDEKEVNILKMGAYE